MRYRPSHVPAPGPARDYGTSRIGQQPRTTRTRHLGVVRAVTAEERRLEESRIRPVNWKRWGPYLSERAWGTVREDYSADGDAWEYFPHDHARSRAYRWNEDGLARHLRPPSAHLLCARAVERAGSDPQGAPVRTDRHRGQPRRGREGVLLLPRQHADALVHEGPLQVSAARSSPTRELVEENRRRGQGRPRVRTGRHGRVRRRPLLRRRSSSTRRRTPRTSWSAITVVESRARGGAAAPAADALVPQHLVMGCRCDASADAPGPASAGAARRSRSSEPNYGSRWLYCDGAPELLFTENETNIARLFGDANGPRYVKDGYQRLRRPRRDATPSTRADRHEGGRALRARRSPPASRRPCGCGCTDTAPARLGEPFGSDFDASLRAAAAAKPTSSTRRSFPPTLSRRRAQRHAPGLRRPAVVEAVLPLRRARTGSRATRAAAAAAASACNGRNREWTHLYNADVISMPDKWEYPWYAAWDLAFHCVPLALVDSEFAKEQLMLMLREWYMHPNGQLPAYEWALRRRQPAGARVGGVARLQDREEAPRRRRPRVPRARLPQAAAQLHLVGEPQGRRGQQHLPGRVPRARQHRRVRPVSAPLPTGGHLEQSDGTSWMAMYCAQPARDRDGARARGPRVRGRGEQVLGALPLHRARDEPTAASDGIELWDEEDGFFYDVLHLPDGSRYPLKVRSMVGFIPLFAVETLEPEMLARLPGFTRRLEWFVEHRPDLTANVACMRTPGPGARRLLAVVDARAAARVCCAVMLDEREFLSPYGIRALSRRSQRPAVRAAGGRRRAPRRLRAGESTSGLFGGNSNWRGPIWFPVNYLLIESLQKFHHYFGDRFTVECPTGSGR